MTRAPWTIAVSAALAAAVLAASPATAQPLPAQTLPAQPYPEKTDYVCTIRADTGEADDQRIRVDLEAKAWCTSKDGCKEVKTLFGLKDAKVILESSQLEVTSYESSIDRATGAYSSSVTTGGLESSSRGACKPAPFTPFGVKLDGSRITGG